MMRLASFCRISWLCIYLTNLRTEQKYKSFSFSFGESHMHPLHTALTRACFIYLNWVFMSLLLRFVSCPKKVMVHILFSECVYHRFRGVDLIVPSSYI